MAEPFDWGLLEPAGAVGVPAGDDRVLAAMIAVEEALVGVWDELDGSAEGFLEVALDGAAQRAVGAGQHQAFCRCHQSPP